MIRLSTKAIKYLKCLRAGLTRTKKTDETNLEDDQNRYKYRPIMFMYENTIPPSRISWKERGFVGKPFSDFSFTGDCYALATITNLDAYMKIRNLYKGSLNWEELVEYTLENKLPLNAFTTFSYAMDKGIGIENSLNQKVCIDSYEVVAHESQFKKVVAHQPLCVGILSTKSMEEHRGEGVFRGEKFPFVRINHLLNIIGYDRRDVEVWELINSWGEDWGNKGCCLFPMGLNHNNIGCQGFFPVVFPPDLNMDKLEDPYVVKSLFSFHGQLLYKAYVEENRKLDVPQAGILRKSLYSIRVCPPFYTHFKIQDALRTAVENFFTILNKEDVDIGHSEMLSHPKFLMVEVTRPTFSSMMYTDGLSKSWTSVGIDPILNLKDVSTLLLRETSQCLFELVAVLAHRGINVNGQYYAYLHQDNGKWVKVDYEANSEPIAEIDFYSLQSEICKTAIVVLYKAC